MATSSFSLKDVATTGVAVAASLAALYSVLSLSVRLDLAEEERDRRRQAQYQSQPATTSPPARRRNRSRKAIAVDQSVGPNRTGAVPGDPALLHSSSSTSDAHAIPTVPPPSMVSAIAPASCSTAILDDSSITITAPDDPLRLSQLDQPTLESELARTDAKLRRLLKRKEKLELRRNQLSVHQMRRVPPDMSEDDPSIVPSVALPEAASQIRPLTADERLLFGLPPMGSGVPMPPSAEGQEAHDRNRRDSVSMSTSSSTRSTYSAADGGAATSPVHAHVPLGVSSLSSEHNELDAAATTSSSSSASSLSVAGADIPVEEESGEVDDDDDGDSDVLSSISDTSAGLESVISDTSLGSDFTFLSDARYGLFHQHG